MKSYPKLRHPIHTKGLSAEDRMILLAYDMIWRARHMIGTPGATVDGEFMEDIAANLANLGHHIEHNLCAMDMALRFEGYDNSSPEDQESFPISSEQMKKEWQDIVEQELNKTNS